jgi:hypothetical protein
VYHDIQENMALSPLETLVAVLCAIILWKLPSTILFRKSSPYPLPPGPAGEPVIGHLRIVPSDKPEIAYAKWSKEYSQLFISYMFTAETHCQNRFRCALLQYSGSAGCGFKQYPSSCRSSR